MTLVLLKAAYSIGIVRGGSVFENDDVTRNLIMAAQGNGLAHPPRPSKLPDLRVLP